MPYDDDDNEFPDPADWTDADAPNADVWDTDLASFRPPSRAGTASLALGAVAGFLLASFSPLVVSANSNLVGKLVAAVVGLASVAGLILAVGALRQPKVKRTFAVIGLLVNLGILIIVFVLATPGRAM
jgi:hypothetical protein